MDIVIQLVGYIFDMLLLFVFLENFLYKRKEQVTTMIAMVVYVGVQIVTAMCNFLNTQVNPFINLLASVGGLVIIVSLYRDSILKKIVAISLYQVFAMIAEVFGAILAQSLELAIDGDILPMGMAISKIFLFVLILLSKLFYKNKSNIPSKYLIYFLLIPLLSIVVMIGLHNKMQNLILYISLLSVLLLNVVSYCLMDVLTGFWMEENKKLRLQEQIETQREKYEQLTASFKQGNRLLHDTNKHIRQIRQYLLENRVNEALEYLDTTDSALNRAYNNVHTGNLVIDSTITNMQNRLNEIGGELSYELNIDVHRINISDYELVIVLGNIMDNALEAVSSVKLSEKKKVLLKLGMSEHALHVYMKNGLEGKGKKRDVGSYPLNKEWFHGLGLLNVKEVVENYGGSISAGAKNGWYETCIVLPILQEEER